MSGKSIKIPKQEQERLEWIGHLGIQFAAKMGFNTVAIG
jgi:hypothetical protein